MSEGKIISKHAAGFMKSPAATVTEPVTEPVINTPKKVKKIHQTPIKGKIKKIFRIHNILHFIIFLNF